MSEAYGTIVSPMTHSLTNYADCLAAARSQLDEEAWAAAWAEGRAMTPDQSAEYALAETSPAPLSIAGSKTPLEPLRIFALGSPRVYRGEHALTPSDWTRAKPKVLLFYLLCHPARTKEQIGLALWPDASAAQLRSGFHRTLHHLRRALGGVEWVSIENNRYSFERSLDYWFDLEAFESNLAEAQRLEAPAQAIPYLEESIDLYGGDLLEDLADEEWAEIRREELRRKYGEALLELGRSYFVDSRYAEAADTYRRVIAHDEYSEAGHRELMRCYEALGERGQALRHYQTLVESLNDEIGSSPAPETTALYERLRRNVDI